MTLRIGFDSTQCACAYDMSNRLINERITIIITIVWLFLLLPSLNLAICREN